MVDLSGMPPAYTGNMMFHGMTEPSAKKVEPIKQSDTGNSLSGNTTSDQPRNTYDRNSRASKNIEAANSDSPIKKPDEHSHPGPPPSFNITILEMERDLAQALARMNAEKSLPGDVEAVSANADKDAPTASGPRSAPEATASEPAVHQSDASPEVKSSEKPELAATSEQPSEEPDSVEIEVSESVDRPQSAEIA